MSHLPPSQTGASDRQKRRAAFAAVVYRWLLIIILTLSLLLCLLALIYGLLYPDAASLSVATVSLGLAVFCLLLLVGQRRGWFSRTRRDEATIYYQAKVLRHVSDAIISTDLNYVVQSWNRAAADIYGWSEEEAVGQPLLDILQTTYHDTTPEAV